jgi:4'-phosphopantetheinyl transferase
MFCSAVHLYSVSLENVADGAYRALAAVLESAESERAQQFRRDADRKAYVASHALLRHALSEFDDQPPYAWRFQADRFGKPHLAGEFASTDLSFSLSHTRSMVLVGVARNTELGVDVERADPSKPHLEIAERFFHPIEIAYLHAARGDKDRCTRFTALWTVKEAFVKALGTGLCQPLDDFVIDLSETGALSFRDPAMMGEPSTWHVHRRRFDDYHCAFVARPNRCGQVRIVHAVLQFDQPGGWRPLRYYLVVQT